MYTVHESLNKEKNVIVLQLKNEDQVVKEFDFESSTERPYDRKVLRQMLDHECKSRNRAAHRKSGASR